MPLSVEVTVDRQKVRVGEDHGVKIRVINSSERQVWAPGILDGSESGVRFPRWHCHVKGPDGELSPPEAPDFTSPLTPSDFQCLMPGEAMDPTHSTKGGRFQSLQTLSAMTLQPGEYAITIEFDTSSEDCDEWEGTLPDFHQTAEQLELARKRVAQTPHIRVASKTTLVLVE